MESQEFSSLTIPRLMKELKAARKEGENETSLYLRPIDHDDLLHWEAVLKGPEGSLYEGGRWHLNIEVPPNYPLAPPIIHFTTKIVHPNIDFETGNVCLSLLKEEWSPAGAGGLAGTLKALQWLLSYPNPDSPLNVDIAVLLRNEDIAGWESIIRYWMEEEQWEEGQNPER
ncbi:Ubiquitin-conjugating enzyme E2 [Penicillium expansum]|nr:Ubiquitin-conjugating enzyme E2 [Penicillium expansum]